MVVNSYYSALILSCTVVSFCAFSLDVQLISESFFMIVLVFKTLCTFLLFFLNCENYRGKIL